MMSQEYTRLPDPYAMQIQELQPVPPSHYIYGHAMQHGSSTVAPPPYELVTVGGAATSTDVGRPAHEVIQDPRKRKCASFGSAYGDEDGDDPRSSRMGPDIKQNHSEIEKRRRDKMNTYITELSSIVPMCGAMSRKLDKLTVLRMTVQHLRSVRGALSACPLSARPRPAFLSEMELNSLILQAANGCFLLVVGCDRGRLIYASASVKKMLYYDQKELLGQSLFDILHPHDVAKVKEQLSSSDLSPRERLIDAKTMLPVKTDLVPDASRFCPGARRSFFCRIKCKQYIDTPNDTVAVALDVKDEDSVNKLRKKQNAAEKRFRVVQFTGYLKSWTPADIGDVGSGCNAEANEESENNNLSCLVAVGRALSDLPFTPSMTMVPMSRRPQFISRHATDGKFMFVDQRVTLALGFLPQELLGTSLYVYISGSELSAVAKVHKESLMKRVPLVTPPYSFRRKDGTVARMQTHFKPFKNPWTKEVECLVANSMVFSETRPPRSEDSFDLFPEDTELQMQHLIGSQVESHKIGIAIAEEALGRTPADSPEMPDELLTDPVFNQQISLVDSVLVNDEVPNIRQVRNNVSLSSAGADSPTLVENTLQIPIGCTPPPISPPLTPLGNDGNGEAAMAVIMSLLEADAGLGGQVDFSNLPWPLP